MDWPVNDLEIWNNASLAIGVAHQGSVIAPDDRIRIAFKLRRIAILAHITPSGGKLCLGNEPSLTGGQQVGVPIGVVDRGLVRLPQVIFSASHGSDENSAAVLLG